MKPLATPIASSGNPTGLCAPVLRLATEDPPWATAASTAYTLTFLQMYMQMHGVD